MRFVLVFKAGNQAKEETYFPRWTIAVIASNLSGGATTYPTNFYLKLSQSTARVAGSSLRGDHNPFTISQDETMAFVYQASSDTEVTLKIYTIYGEPVKTLIDNKPVQNGVTYDGTTNPNWKWDGKNGANREVSSGIYTAILTAKDGSQPPPFNFVVYK
jgi:flagellar hook assembly protein FlgD